MDHICAWYKLNFSKSHMRRIQYVDPVGHSKMAQRIRICNWTTAIVILLLLVAVSLSIYYSISAEATSTNNTNTTTTPALPTSTEKLFRTEASSVKVASDVSREDRVNFTSRSTTPKTYADTTTENVPDQIPPATARSGLEADKHEQSTKPSGARSPSSTPSYEELLRKLQATISQLATLNQTLGTATDGKSKNCSSGNDTYCIRLETGNFIDSSSGGNASEGFVVVRGNGLWQLYCGSWDTFAHLSASICPYLGFSEPDFLQRFPLAELRALGVNVHADNGTEIDSGSCDAGYVRCNRHK